jgi:PmbA protein
MRANRDTSSLLQLAEWLVEYGLKENADEIEAAVSESDHLEIDVRMGRIENLTRAVSRRLSVCVFKNQRRAISGTSDLSKSTLKQLVKRAIKRTEFSEPDAYAGLPETSSIIRDSASLRIYDPAVRKISTDFGIQTALEMENIGREDSRITNSLGASFESQESRSFLANSNGFSGDYKETFFYLGLGLQGGCGDNRVEGYWSSTSRFLNELEKPEEIARTAVQRTVRLINPKKIGTKNVPVIFEPNMTSWLLGFLFTCVSGSSAYHRASFLADELGKTIAVPEWTVIDDGIMPGKLGSAPFDSEGVPCRKTKVLNRGNLENFLCNTYAARKLELASTGNAQGRGIGPTNFYLKKGNRSPDEIISSLNKGLILVRTIGHGLNPVTGDISKGAYGLWVENGRILFPVSEITIAGNLGRILQQPIIVGNDLKFRSSVSGPTLQVAEMTIAGT